MEVGLPADVLHVVVVEVDGAVLAGGESEAGLGAGEVVAGHAAGGHVDGLAVEAVGAGVGDAVAADVEAEVPGGDRVAHGRIRD